MMEVRDGTLWVDGAPVAPEAVRGFEERFDALSGELCLRVRGIDQEVAPGASYGELRAALRAAYGDRPFVATWSDGVFPHGWFGRRGAGLGLVAVAGLMLVVALGMVWPTVGVFAGGLFGWALVRAVPRVRVDRRGLSAGVPWAPVVPWHAVRAVHHEVRGRVTRVAVASATGWSEGEVPTAVVPALRARLRRLGGLTLQPMPETVEWSYQRWRGPAVGGMWGLGAGALAAVLASPVPWSLLPTAVALATAGALLGLAVELRASGWGAGAAFALSLLYALGLTALTTAWP